ncbi:type VII secretion-associated serine protease mycosin [Solwaraspora sp. WMMD1047]|uniref:type VII secretion-associated serine protease mycosin n=1 Tax=Solwaraspora sp. WMMD1047 TaxID=3016102 RepID=UPI002415C377|nr:type VII secretion-associated serine protease mycosin [Solwaraspora sp. WMMD1047]MDG4833884.1 type VII secretion-associated serine protease mycosin [Solwaraspora sp. WMMD1047]
MPGGSTPLALVIAVTLTVPPVAPAAATDPAADPVSTGALAGPVLAQRATVDGCTDRSTPAEPVAELPWSQRRYAPERLTALATGAGVTVAVLDSGVDDRHLQLRDRVLPGRDYLDPELDGTVDCPGHGTAVASLIAATPRDGIGLRGLAPGSRILPVRVSEQLVIDGAATGRTVTATRFAAAIRYAVTRGAAVLNLSVVLYRDDPAVRAAIADAVAADVVVVAAVGNRHDEADPRPFPAAYDGVLGVGAVGPDGQRAPFSQVGPYVDVVAPGQAVLAAVPGRGHREHDGTSYAVPFASATAALIRQYRPELSARQVIERIVTTADPAPGDGDDGYGGGVLNPYRAVTETAPLAAGPPPAPVVRRGGTDPAAVGGGDRRTEARERALALAGVAGAGAALAVLLAVVLPRGVRRRWRPAEPA